MKKISKRSLRIDHYIGKGSLHESGFSESPINLEIAQYKIRENYKEKTHNRGTYSIDHGLIEIHEDAPEFFESRDSERYIEKEGKLAIRILGRSEKSLEEISEEIGLPFDKQLIRENKN
jgi:hypothetical protein